MRWISTIVVAIVLSSPARAQTRGGLDDLKAAGGGVGATPCSEFNQSREKPEIEAMFFSWTEGIGLNVSPCVIGICRGSISMMKRTGIFLVSTAFMISAAVAQMAPAKIGDTSKGKALVNDKGIAGRLCD